MIQQSHAWGNIQIYFYESFVSGEPTLSVELQLDYFLLLGLDYFDITRLCGEYKVVYERGRLLKM